jgi:hypothetical protein
MVRWQKPVGKRGLIGLEEGDQRPYQVRRPQWNPETAEAVLRLREAHPGMGKEKLWKPPEPPAKLGDGNGRDG